MPRIWKAVMVSSLLLPTSLWAQEVFVSGDNQAAAEVRKDLERTTRFRCSPSPANVMLLVETESWSPDFFSPAVVAVEMKLISPTGQLLWSRTEPIGSRSDDATVRDLLRDLGKAVPQIREEQTAHSKSDRPSHST